METNEFYAILEYGRMKAISSLEKELICKCKLNQSSQNDIWNLFTILDIKK